MASYTYNYACGHGQGKVSLVGKHTERERKLAWYEANHVCQECYKTQKQAEDDAADKIATLVMAPGAEVYIGIKVTGQIAANQQALYDIGFGWMDEIGGFFEYLSLNAPKRVMQTLERFESMAEIEAWVKTKQAELATLGYKLVNGLSPLDEGLIAHTFASKAKEDADAAIAKAQRQTTIDKTKTIDPAPTPPKWYADLKAQHGEAWMQYKTWNRKFYGNAKYGYRIYVLNNEVKLTAEQVDAFNVWQQKHKEWKEFWGL